MVTPSRIEVTSDAGTRRAAFRLGVAADMQKYRRSARRFPMEVRDAVPFYEAHGYERIRTVTFEFGGRVRGPAVEMTTDL